MPKQVDDIKVYNYGEKGSGFVTKGEPQDYESIKKDCMKKGKLFEDPEFDIQYKEYQWKRPWEIVKNPQFFVEGVSRFDTNQGALGDCWFIAAVANLTLNEKLLYRVVPPDQSFDRDYWGVFHFRFWQYGKWVDVVVDDRLPVQSNGRLAFMSSNENEFWNALLEKAFAKLHGSYDNLNGGFTRDALQDFTGGIGELVDISNHPDLYKNMFKAYQRGSLMGCAITNTNVMEGVDKNGLVSLHAYSITKVHPVKLEHGFEAKLIRIRNPWGNEIEWTGAWSDQSEEWNAISEETRNELGISFDNDGEFWMCFEDFVNNFTMLEYCHLIPDAKEEEINTSTSRKKWVTSMYSGEWRKGVSAGGSFINRGTFHCNPQYSLILTDPDEDDNEDNCTLIISLLQAHTRRKGNATHIGVSIYQLNNADQENVPLGESFFKYNRIHNHSPFLVRREVTHRVKLPPGVYCIIPSTLEPHRDGTFVLRIFTENKNDLKENDVTLQDMCSAYDNFVQSMPLKISSKYFEKFLKFAGDDKLIDAEELMKVLNDSFGSKGEIISLHTCRRLLSLLDEDNSGNLDFVEYQKLCQLLSIWMECWNKYDKDNSGTLNGFELRELLKSCGFEANTRILNALILRYGNKERELEFDKYILCLVKLKKLMDSFTQRQNNQGLAVFQFDDYLLHSVRI